MSFLKTFGYLSPFVTVQISNDHLKISVINQSLTTFAILKLDSLFFSSFSFNSEYNRQLFDISGGIKLGTSLFSESLKCEAIIDTRVEFCENQIVLSKTLSSDLETIIKLNFESIEFIDALVQDNYPHMILSLGSVWTRALTPHLVNSRSTFQIHLNFTDTCVKLKSLADIAIENEIPKSVFHTWKKEESTGEYKIIAPLDELIEIMQLADRQKALVQCRFGHNPLIIELISSVASGCLARFVISCLEGDERTISISNTRRARKRRQNQTFVQENNDKDEYSPYKDFQVTEQLEEMLIEEPDDLY
jgi:hypothetical protein